VRVGLLDEHPGELLHVRKEATPEVDGVLKGDAIGLAETEVLGAIEGAGVDDAGAVFGRDEIGRDDVVSPALYGGGTSPLVAVLGEASARPTPLESKEVTIDGEKVWLTLKRVD